MACFAQDSFGKGRLFELKKKKADPDYQPILITFQDAGGFFQGFWGIFTLRVLVY